MQARVKCAFSYVTVAVVFATFGMVADRFVYGQYALKRIGNSNFGHRLNADYFDIYEIATDTNGDKSYESHSLSGSVESISFSFAIVPSDKPYSEESDQLRISVEDRQGTLVTFSTGIKRMAIFDSDQTFATSKGDSAEEIKYWDFDVDGVFDFVYNRKQNRRSIIKNGCLVDVSPSKGNSLRGPFTVRDGLGEQQVSFSEGSWEITQNTPYSPAE